MNYITVKKIIDLREVLDHKIYLSGEISKTEEQEEIDYNGWEIILDDELAKNIKAEELANFIKSLIKYKSDEVCLIKPLTEATLYFWFDDFPVRLCFNVLSGKDRHLPFNCRINTIDSPYPILKQFVKESYDYALRGNLHEIQFFEKGDPDFDEDYEVDLDQVTIDVWKITLPWNGEIEFYKS